MSAVVIGDVTYVGGVDEVTQKGQPHFGLRDTYEPDRATLTYQAAPDAALEFAEGLTRGAYMEYIDGNGASQPLTTMYLTNVRRSDDPVLAEVSMDFVGIMDDLPPPEIRDSLATANVSTTVTTTADPPSTLTLNIEYKAARTTYNWYTLDEPDPNVPEYTDVTNTTSPFDEANHRITRWQIVGGTTGQTIALADFIALISSLTLQTNFEGYEISEVVPGKLWKCSVTVQAVIVGA